MAERVLDGQKWNRGPRRTVKVKGFSSKRGKNFERQGQELINIEVESDQIRQTMRTWLH